MISKPSDSWSSGEAYERFMGRWSTLVAHRFLAWMAVPLGSSWLDIGCGTGSLTKLILETCQPRAVIGIDSSSEFIAHATHTIIDPMVRFQVGDAQALELDTSSVDVVVSGIMLNFVPQPKTALREMIRVLKPDGSIGIFLWDYAEGMEMLRYFWDAAVQLDSNAKPYDEGFRFPLCQEGQLEILVKEMGLKQVEATAVEITTEFQDFDEYWLPFLGQVGPAPSYVLSLSREDREKLKDKLHEALPIREDGSISLRARAWAVKGTA